MSFSNYHTHSLYCDGRNSPEEIINKAIELGLCEIGFSGHSYTYFDKETSMSPEDTEKYCLEIRRLQEKYKDKISVRLGIEYDFLSDIDTSGFDYVIGGVHYLKKNGEIFTIDQSPEEFLRVVNVYYGGDVYSLCEDYYKALSGIYEKTGCDIVAHFDLVTKYNDGNSIFDTKHPRYIKAATDALDILVKKPVIFEINTGAIARLNKSKPYPEESFVNIIHSAGRDTILSSDCHNMNYLTESFEKYKHLATLDKLPIKQK